MTDASFESHDEADSTANDSRQLLADGGVTDGLATIESDASVTDSVKRVKDAIEQKEKLGLMAEFDHKANAATVDRDLPPTTVLVFGNPDLGTPLMQAGWSIAIDLPMKLLVTKEDDGTVTVTYNDPAYLVNRHDIEDKDDWVETASDALSSLAAVAAGEE